MKNKILYIEKELTEKTAGKNFHAACARYLRGYESVEASVIFDDSDGVVEAARENQIPVVHVPVRGRSFSNPTHLLGQYQSPRRGLGSLIEAVSSSSEKGLADYTGLNFLANRMNNDEGLSKKTY